MNITNISEDGVIYINGNKTNNISNIQWINHPKYAGVLIKNLLSGDESNNNLSAMLVRIEPHHEIGNHVHEGRSELHEIISGKGIATIDNTQINYGPGVISFIPNDIPHSVKAGDTDMILLAKFTPPLS